MNLKTLILLIISNARCLTEGVDLPAVDMVAFMSPKKSKVDIIQATGRAMRKDPQNPDKTLGYILVPLYLEITTGERIEDAVDKADFGEVWNVLQALQEQDEVLADIIRQMQEDKGKGEEQKGDDFGDIIDILGVDISLKTLKESITALCIDKLGFMREKSWEEMFDALIKYKYRNYYGDCNVPDGWSENRALGQWVITQRANYKANNLRDDRIKRLEEIGFEWVSPLRKLEEEMWEEKWKEKFDMLKEYKKHHGDCNIPTDWTDKHLVNWVAAQRSVE